MLSSWFSNFFLEIKKRLENEKEIKKVCLFVLKYTIKLYKIKINGEFVSYN